MKSLKHSLLLFLIIWGIWILLTSTDRQELAAGAILSLAVTLIFRKQTALLGDIRLTPRALMAAFAYFFVFLLELLKSNLDVAWRVINPRLPIHPGIVKAETRLTSPLARTILANSITLTPGTLTVETTPEAFYIHWIDIPSRQVAENTRQIIRRFEKYLEVIFG